MWQPMTAVDCILVLSDYAPEEVREIKEAAETTDLLAKLAMNIKAHKTDYKPTS